jgi:OmpA-OmpF porin, OOP family
MKNSAFFFTLFLFLFALSFDANAQKSPYRFPDEVGLLLGASSYAGDIVKIGDYDLGIVGLSVGAFYRHPLTNNISIRLGLNQTTLSGDDNRWEGTDRVQRGFNFTSSLTEFSARTEFDFFNHRRKQSAVSFRKIFSPFVYIGAGFSLINPKTDYQPNKNPQLQALIAQDIENTPSIVFTLPFGGGFRFDWSERILIGVEAGLNPVYSDYLDGISQSGQPNNDDWYMLGGISLSYRLQPLFSAKLRK